MFFYESGSENKVYSRTMHFDKINKKRVEKLRLNNWIKQIKDSKNTLS